MMASLLLSPPAVPFRHSSPAPSHHWNPPVAPDACPFPVTHLRGRTPKQRRVAVYFALAEPLDREEPLLPLLQDMADSLDLPPDYLAKLPRDLRLDLNDAAFDLSNGPVLDECGQELGEMLLNLARSWEQADTSTSHSIASKLPLLQNSLNDDIKAALGRRLVSAGRRFQSMGQYGQGELQRVYSTSKKLGLATGGCLGILCLFVIWHVMLPLKRMKSCVHMIVLNLTDITLNCNCFD